MYPDQCNSVIMIQYFLETIGNSSTVADSEWGIAVFVCHRTGIVRRQRDVAEIRIVCASRLAI